MKWRVLIVVLIALACGPIAVGTADGPQPPPGTYTGMLDGTPYEIVVPPSWNGTLLVFAHGQQLTAPTPVVAPPNVKASLLAAGYALAGSGFTSSYKDGVLRTHQLTGFFREAFAEPQRIIIWGNSLGGAITAKLIEKYPGIYDGAIANCAPDAGAVENMDSALAFSLAFDAAFSVSGKGGWLEDWGSIADVRDDLVVPDVLPYLQTLSIPANEAEWEFVRLVMHVPSEAFWTVDPGTGNQFKFFQLQMWKATVLRSAAEADNGGPVAENVGMHYWVDTAGYARLALLGLAQEQVDAMLASMNERTNIRADRAARRHLAQWGAPSGQLRRPVLTMHHPLDGMAYVTNESYYEGLVEAAGAESLLVQTYVKGVIGHCYFTPTQYTSAINAMNSWLDTGTRPGASFFPAAAFDLAFSPGPWIF